MTIPGATISAAAPPSEVEAAVMRALAYADLFGCPLTAQEAHRYLVGVETSPEAVRSALDALVRGPVGRTGDQYFLAGREPVVALRRRRVKMAARLWPAARDLAGAVGALPFVRMVAITGSLARDNVDTGADVDLLIVAEPGRLWVCRAFVGFLARRAARRNVVLCANYYVAESALALPERDLYTACELAQMIPIEGLEVYERLRRSNRWADAVLPNARGRPGPAGQTGARGGATTAGNGAVARHPASRRWSRLAEAALRTPLGSGLDRLERWRKRRQAMRQRRDLAEARFERDRFKGHFEGHARRIGAAYEARLRSLGLDPGPVPVLAGAQAPGPVRRLAGAPGSEAAGP